MHGGRLVFHCSCNLIPCFHVALNEIIGLAVELQRETKSHLLCKAVYHHEKKEKGYFKGGGEDRAMTLLLISVALFDMGTARDNFRSINL